MFKQTKVTFSTIFEFVNLLTFYLYYLQLFQLNNLNYNLFTQTAEASAKTMQPLKRLRLCFVFVRNQGSRISNSLVKSTAFNLIVSQKGTPILLYKNQQESDFK